MQFCKCIIHKTSVEPVHLILESKRDKTIPPYYYIAHVSLARVVMVTIACKSSQ